MIDFEDMSKLSAEEIESVEKDADMCMQMLNTVYDMSKPEIFYSCILNFYVAKMVMDGEKEDALRMVGTLYDYLSE